MQDGQQMFVCQYLKGHPIRRFAAKVSVKLCFEIYGRGEKILTLPLVYIFVFITKFQTLVSIIIYD